MAFNQPTNTTDKYQWQQYDWDWLDDASMGSNPSSTVKNIYTQQGGLNRALGRGVISDWMRSQQANNASLEQKRQNLQGSYDYRDRSDQNFANQQTQIGEKEALTEQSLQDTQARQDENMNSYYDRLMGSGGYVDKIQNITSQGASSMGAWGDKAVAKMEESSEKFDDFSTQQASAVARGGAAALQSRNAQLDGSNMPENVKQSMKDLNQRQFDQDLFSQQTALQGQAQQTRIGLDQSLASTYSQRGQIAGAAAQMEAGGLAQGAQAETTFWGQKTQLDAQLGANRTDFRKFMTGMEQQSHQAQAGVDFQVQQLISQNQNELVEAIRTNPVSLLDGLSGLASLYSSSQWAANRLANVTIPGNRYQVNNPNFKGYNQHIGQTFQAAVY
tara:strand:- start:13816 stop:14976 length:1161 start_codon:yes stop_codon:yes gene_type:complete